MLGQVAFVTGASSGIGRAVALELAREGADIALVALPGADLHEAAAACQAIGVKALAISADVSDSDAVRAAFKAADSLGPISALFNNAGYARVVPMVEMTDEQFLHQLHVNLSGAFYVAREAVRRMIPRKQGALVFTASELSLIGESGYVGYSATKGGILGMSRALAAEVVRDGIRVNVVCPGSTETPLLKREFEYAADPISARVAMQNSIAMGRFATAEEIAKVVVFLLSADASYITGVALPVDGGRLNCVVPGTVDSH
jgi:NAD(P)-dependent dehydrogenase (short-subunit alcohol dehydrogenase family)